MVKSTPDMYNRKLHRLLKSRLRTIEKDGRGALAVSPNWCPLWLPVRVNHSQCSAKCVELGLCRLILQQRELYEVNIWQLNGPDLESNPNIKIWCSVSMPNVKCDRIRPSATKDPVHCLKTGRTYDVNVACTNSLTAASQVARFADLPGNISRATCSTKRFSRRDETEEQNFHAKKSNQIKLKSYFQSNTHERPCDLDSAVRFII